MSEAMVTETVADFPDWTFTASIGSEVVVLPLPGEMLDAEEVIATIKAERGDVRFFATGKTWQEAWEKLVPLMKTDRGPAR